MSLGELLCKFKVVKDGVEKKYGPRYHVTKEECIGHEQKRMGNALRRFFKGMTGKRMNDNKTVGGKVWLTKEKIDQLQRYYGQAIRQNVGDLNRMQNAVWAIFHHTVKPASLVSLESQHSLCPKGGGGDSWCKFNSDLFTKEKIYLEFSSPSCANFAPKYTAKVNTYLYSEEAAEVVKDDFYIDDILKSTETMNSAIDLIRKVKRMCSAGCFGFTKFNSNDCEVISSSPKDDQAPNIKNVDVNYDGLPIERALGMHWNTENDQLY